MAKRGKKYQQNAGEIDRDRVYPFDEGLGLAVKAKYAKFDESLDVAVRLGVDPRHADQMIRSSVALPNGTGKTERVLVFAKGEKVQEEKAGQEGGGAPLNGEVARPARIDLL